MEPPPWLQNGRNSVELVRGVTRCSPVSPVFSDVAAPEHSSSVISNVSPIGASGASPPLLCGLPSSADGPLPAHPASMVKNAISAVQQALSRLTVHSPVPRKQTSSQSRAEHAPSPVMPTSSQQPSGRGAQGAALQDPSPDSTLMQVVAQLMSAVVVLAASISIKSPDVAGSSPPVSESALQLAATQNTKPPLSVDMRAASTQTGRAPTRQLPPVTVRPQPAAKPSCLDPQRRREQALVRANPPSPTPRQLLLRQSRQSIGIDMGSILKRLHEWRKPACTPVVLARTLRADYGDLRKRSFAYYAVKHRELVDVSGQANNCALRAIVLSVTGCRISDDEAATLRRLCEAILNRLSQQNSDLQSAVLPAKLGTPRGAIATLRTHGGGNAYMETATLFPLTVAFPALAIKVDEPVEGGAIANSQTVNENALLLSPALSSVMPKPTRDQPVALPRNGVVVAHVLRSGFHYNAIVPAEFRRIRDDTCLLSHPTMSVAMFTERARELLADSSLIDSMLQAHADVTMTANAIELATGDDFPLQRSGDVATATQKAWDTFPALRSAIESLPGSLGAQAPSTATRRLVPRTVTLQAKRQALPTAQRSSHANPAGPEPATGAPGAGTAGTQASRPPVTVPAAEKPGPVPPPVLADSEQPCCCVCGAVSHGSQQAPDRLCSRVECKHRWHVGCVSSDSRGAADPTLCPACAHASHKAVKPPIREKKAAPSRKSVASARPPRKPASAAQQRSPRQSAGRPVAAPTTDVPAPVSSGLASPSALQKPTAQSPGLRGPSAPDQSGEEAVSAIQHTDGEELDRRQGRRAQSDAEQADAWVAELAAQNAAPLVLVEAPIPAVGEVAASHASGSAATGSCGAAPTAPDTGTRSNSDASHAPESDETGSCGAAPTAPDTGTRSNSDASLAPESAETGSCGAAPTAPDAGTRSNSDASYAPDKRKRRAAPGPVLSPAKARATTRNARAIPTAPPTAPLPAKQGITRSSAKRRGGSAKHGGPDDIAATGAPVAPAETLPASDSSASSSSQSSDSNAGRRRSTRRRDKGSQ